jgi:hypothetical protein
MKAYRLFARRWRGMLVLAALVMALAQGVAFDHRIHDLSTAHQVPCQVCLLSSGQGAALLTALPSLPSLHITQEAPTLPALPVILIDGHSTTWARAPPA